MRKLSYISPTSLTKFYDDQQAFYLYYLAEKSPPRDPQTPPMSVGSAFDAYVKSYLHGRLFGEGHDPRYELTAIFEAQVESHNRDGAKIAGAYLFDEYKKSGALAAMMLELQGSITEPRFEFDLHGVVDYQRESEERLLGAVPFLGKPDLFFRNKSGASVIHDWKVNGYYSAYNISPAQGYIRLRQNGVDKGCHKDAMRSVWNGMLINIATTLDTVKTDWAQQLSIYMWLCGEDVGSQMCVASIDQVVCRKSEVRPFPDIRFAEHRAKISRDFQLDVYRRAQEAWEIINSDHFFRNLEKEVSQAKCEQLDNYYKDLLARQSESTSLDKWHDQVTRPY